MITKEQFTVSHETKIELNMLFYNFVSEKNEQDTYIST